MLTTRGLCAYPRLMRRPVHLRIVAQGLNGIKCSSCLLSPNATLPGYQNLNTHLTTSQKAPYSASKRGLTKQHLRDTGASASYSPGQPTMGKKKQRKGKRRAAEASAAAIKHEISNTGNPATQSADFLASSASVQGQTLETLSGIPAGGHPFQGFYQPSPQWPAGDAAIAANGSHDALSVQPSQLLNAFQSFIMQPNFFTGFQPNRIGMPFFQPNMNMGSLNPQQQTGSPAGAQSQHMGAQMFLNPFMGTSQASPSMPSPEDADASKEKQPERMPASPRERSDRLPPTPPSAASGGVPNPTDSYLMRASFLPKRRAHPGPLLVVIDLNGTLLHRPDRRASHKFQARPHAEQFTKYCIETFWVVIWSSARPENVKKMVNALMGPTILKQVVAVWGRDRFNLTREDYNLRTQCYKRLTTLWDDPLVQSSYPRLREGFEGGCWNQGNTVLIDDSIEKARSEPHNAITLPEFTGDMGEDPNILPRVHDYLNELCFQEDVSTYIRATPFKMA